MLMNYQSQQLNVKMGLEEAINNFQGEICYLTLKDGTNIEIVQKNQPEMGYINNKLNSPYEYNDEFVEEIQEQNFNNFNYEDSIPNQSGPLRGRGQKKKLGKSLRKTVLKSIDGKEKVKEIKSSGKLRNLKEKIIYQETENNDFIQCANCFKFFPKDEKENENEIASNSNNPQTPNNQQVPSQPQNNQFFPPHQQQNKIMPPNQPMGKQQRPPQQPQQPPRPGQKIPKYFPKQQYIQVVPPLPQRDGRNQRQKINIPQGRPNQIPMPQQFKGQNYVFRARKKVNRYESNNDRYYNSKNNYLNNNVNTQRNYYPASGHKQKTENILCDECSSGKKMTHNTSYGNLNVARNLNFGFSGSKKETGYKDNNLTEYIDYGNDYDNAEYYEYPSTYQRQNIIPTGYNKGNNHKVVTTKTIRNYYQDYDY